MTVLRSYGWVAYDASGRPAAYIGGDVYDRWVTYRGEGPDGPLLSGGDARVSMALICLVDPARRRQGHGRAAITTVLAHPGLRDVRAFYCGIDAGNHPSRRCATSAGFELLDPTPDFEDIVYYRYAR
ncbi:GNAT family N-acetyltransferase [Actinoallomurus iriomotensis]|uniref:N-acetyltransferase domain-containing protein n=1 Tax=Actinoallomurus iriomotensis TaxID=478107 RepID=A0A9W6VM48_9ACTN|nr:GNAT family protein [Actinoallomurus iriomotensis]GLY72324.1 hypothetical protein Airi01_005910 [Actinoallomurus iriomotensis]